MSRVHASCSDDVIPDALKRMPEVSDESDHKSTTPFAWSTGMNDVLSSQGAGLEIGQYFARRSFAGTELVQDIYRADVAYMHRHTQFHHPGHNADGILLRVRLQGVHMLYIIDIVMFMSSHIVTLENLEIPKNP